MVLHTKKRHEHTSSGFTIIELMIATLVFATVLLVVTTGIIQFTRSYYRGATVAKTQDTARTIMDTVAQSIQYGNPLPTVVDVAGTPQFFCAGGYQFIFTKGVQYKLEPLQPSNVGLFLVSAPSECETPNPLPADNRRQLLNNNMRLLELDQNHAGNGLYSVAVTVAYGDNDLLCDSSTPETCEQAAATLSDVNLAAAGSKVRCKQQAGSEFCAVSTLSTTVKKRIQ